MEERNGYTASRPNYLPRSSSSLSCSMCLFLLTLYLIEIRTHCALQTANAGKCLILTSAFGGYDPWRVVLVEDCMFQFRKFQMLIHVTAQIPMFQIQQCHFEECSNIPVAKQRSKPTWLLRLYVSEFWEHHGSCLRHCQITGRRIGRTLHSKAAWQPRGPNILWNPMGT